MIKAVFLLLLAHVLFTGLAQATSGLFSGLVAVSPASDIAAAPDSTSQTITFPFDSPVGSVGAGDTLYADYGGIVPFQELYVTVVAADASAVRLTVEPGLERDLTADNGRLLSAATYRWEAALTLKQTTLDLGLFGLTLPIPLPNLVAFLLLIVDAATFNYWFLQGQPYIRLVLGVLLDAPIVTALVRLVWGAITGVVSRGG